MSILNPSQLSAAIRKQIAASFSSGDRVAAADLVATFVGPSWERVQRVLLALSDGDLGSLADMTRLAREDYRDVLYWEEYTGPGKLRSAPAREWIEKHFAQLGVAVPKGLR